MLTLREVTKTYPGNGAAAFTALQNASLHLDKGEFVVITGRSGSGKTTLLNLAAGLLRPTAGSVHFQERDLWALSDADRSRLRSRTIGFIFQFPSLLPTLTALENVALPTVFVQERAQRDPWARAQELLGTVGLTAKAGAYPRQLSAGEQQRVVIARALMNAPELLCADEPTSNLDERTEQEIMDLFRQIHTALGVTILLVTHSSALVSYGSRALEMRGGMLVTANKPNVCTAETRRAQSFGM